MVPTLSSAGIRPMSAFVVIGVVVLVVAGWVGWLTNARSASQPDLARQDRGETPGFELADSAGLTLACFAPRFDLEMSPRSMWQAHTPQLMAERIAGVLGGRPTSAELLERFLPDAQEGWIEVEAWNLSARQAHALSDWLGGDAQEGRPPVDGMWVESSDGGLSWRILWQPLVVLDAEQRERHGQAGALAWGRHLAVGITTALHGPDHSVRPSAATLERWSADVWSALLPSAWNRPIEGIAPECVDDLRSLLEAEGVAPWQMRVVHGRDRTYPRGAQELLGSWGFVGEKATRPSPRSGLELVGETLLADPVWTERLDLEPPLYRWRGDRTVRGTRATSFLEHRSAPPAPVVESTIDLALQEFLRTQLVAALREHRPALALGIVLDVETGDVLAVDSVEAYPIQPFAPVYHVFTAGSTLKVLTMACALEEGVVDLDAPLDVGDGAWRIVYGRGPKAGQRSARVIREAEGAPIGVIDARHAFAFSVNAGLAQIGLRMEDAAFRGYLEALGYGRPAGSGLGAERAGHLVGLPWKYAYTHTSICFGHEISTTLWQHAAALATVVRGGLHRPLRLVRSVSQGEERWPLELAGGERVFSEPVCAEVRDLMRLGAREGTGERVRDLLLELAAGASATAGAEPEPLDEALLDVGTKTGTAQKVASELCVHVEMEARERWREAGLAATRERFRALGAEPRPHRNCYTSSICVFGRVAGEAPGLAPTRELMTLVVVEEPRGKKRFGSDVAGPVAARVLAEALGLTVDGRPPLAPLRREPAPVYASLTAARNTRDEPWRVGRVP